MYQSVNDSSAYEREKRLHEMVQLFLNEYGPPDGPHRDECEVRFRMIMREHMIEAQRPFHMLAANAIASRPFPTMRVPKDTEFKS